MKGTPRKRAAKTGEAPASRLAVVVNLAAWKARRGLQCEYQGANPLVFEVGDYTISLHYLGLLEALPDYGLEAGDRLMVTLGLAPIPGEFAAAETPQGWRVGRLDPEGIRAGEQFIDPARSSRVGRVTAVERAERCVWTMPQRKGEAG